MWRRSLHRGRNVRSLSRQMSAPASDEKRSDFPPLPYSGECKGGFPDQHDTPHDVLARTTGQYENGEIAQGWYYIFWNVQSDDGHGIQLPVHLCGLRETERKISLFSDGSQDEDGSIIRETFYCATNMFVRSLPCAMGSEFCDEHKNVCRCEPVDKIQQMERGGREIMLDDIRPFLHFPAGYVPNNEQVMYYFSLDIQFTKLWCNREKMMEVDRLAREYVRTQIICARAGYIMCT